MWTDDEGNTWERCQTCDTPVPYPMAECAVCTHRRRRAGVTSLPMATDTLEYETANQNLRAAMERVTIAQDWLEEAMAARDQAIIELHAAGGTQREIAATVGISHVAVGNVLRRRHR